MWCLKSLPLPSPPLGCAKGRGPSSAPSLVRSAGEGWGGVKPLPLQWFQASPKTPNNLPLTPTTTPIQLPIPNRLGQMRPLDGSFGSKIGNRPCDPQNPVH